MGLTYMATDYQSLLSSTNVACYASQPPGIQTILELALLQLIAQNIGGAGGGGAPSCQNLGGNPPLFVPSSGCGGPVIDTSNGRIWWYFNGQWN